MSNPTTFLELAQQLRQEARIPSPTTAATPTTVLAQTGELKDIVDWTGQAWVEIQGQKHWSWMWENPTVTILANTSTLAQTVSAERYIFDTAYVPATTGTTSRKMRYYAWDEFRRRFPSGDIVAGTPYSWTVRPDGAIAVNSKPTANMDITLERYATPTYLTADTDQPGMPADLRMLIVWMALMKHADELEAGARRSTAQDNASRLMRDLNTRCLPALRLGAPLM